MRKARPASGKSRGMSESSSRKSPGTPNPRVAVIGINWRGLDDTIACLASLREVTYPNYEVVVVDNDSTDGSVDRIGRAFPAIPTLRGVVNGGYAAGNNEGIRSAPKQGTNFVLILNNDVIVDRGFLQPMIDQAMGERSPGVVTCRALLQSDPRRVCCRRFYVFLYSLVNALAKSGVLIVHYGLQGGFEHVLKARLEAL